MAVNATKRKSHAQLEREIAAALARKPSARLRRHHATVRDDWDVAMDAILEHDPKRAAQIVRAIRAEHGATVSEPAAFSNAVSAAPDKVQNKFFELTDDTGKPEFRDAEIAQMFTRIPIKPTDNSLTEAVLGNEPIYTRRFRMPKFNNPVTALQTADVAIRHHNELGIPTSKHAHTLRADFLRDLKRRFDKEGTRLFREGKKAYGTYEHGPLISGGFHEHWPTALKDKLRFLAHGETKLSDAIQLHQKLSKTRSSAFH